MRKPLWALVFAFLVILGVGSSANAAPITLTWTFTGSPGDQLSEPVDAQIPGLFATDIHRNGASPATGLNTINSSNWTTGPTPEGAYYEFLVGIDFGYSFSFQSIEFTMGRSATGPATAQIALDFGNAAFASTTFNLSSTGDVRRGFALSPVPVAAALRVRIYGYDATDADGRLWLGKEGPGPDSFPAANLQLFGDLVALPPDPELAVPEPGTVCLLGFGLIGAAVRCRRRR